MEDDNEEKDEGEGDDEDRFQANWAPQASFLDCPIWRLPYLPQLCSMFIQYKCIFLKMHIPNPAHIYPPFAAQHFPGAQFA